MGWMFLLAIAFIAPAFWLPDEIKEIVLALSAVLVSVTFIFGNTLGEVRIPCSLYSAALNFSAPHACMHVELSSMSTFCICGSATRLGVAHCTMSNIRSVFRA